MDPHESTWIAALEEEDMPLPESPVMARPGYGKRTVFDPRDPDRPLGPRDLEHLREREAKLLKFIDSLPEGAQMGVEALDKAQPLYGRTACASAMRRLTEAGHLRRFVFAEGGVAGRRTYFSRFPRTDEWWEELLASVAAGLCRKCRTELDADHHWLRSPIFAVPLE